MQSDPEISMIYYGKQNIKVLIQYSKYHRENHCVTFESLLLSFFFSIDNMDCNNFYNTFL